MRCLIAATAVWLLSPSVPAFAQRATPGHGVGHESPAIAGTAPSRDHPPMFDPRRYPEDYRYLADPDQRTGAWWETLKLIPLAPEASSALTLGGELRARTESYANNLFSAAPRGDDGYVWERALPYADLHLGRHVRVFGQMELAYSQGQKGGASPLDRTGADWLQGFVELSAPVANGRLSARAGRQVVSYGDGSLIDSRYGPNVLQSFDGVFANFTRGRWRGDLFWARPVVSGLRDFDDRASRDQRIWGAIVGHDLPRVERGVVDLAYMGFRDDTGRFVGGGGAETRHTVALRHAGAAGRLDWKGEAIGQLGHARSGPVRAYALAAEAGYAFPRAPLAPRLHANGGVASGDADPTRRGSRTFNALFPRGQYFSDTGLIGPYNVINARFGGQLAPSAGLKLDAIIGLYWRESRRDAVYRNGGGVLFPATAGRGRFVARQYELTVDYGVTRGVDLRLTLAAFDRGRFVRSIPGSRAVRFAGLETRLWF